MPQLYCVMESNHVVCGLTVRLLSIHVCLPAVCLQFLAVQLCTVSYQCVYVCLLTDEIMQQEIRPLLAVDIIEQLHRQFALLSGMY